MPHKKDCGHCEKNYTGECRPVDVKDCIKHGRHTKFKPSEIHRRMGHCKEILDAETGKTMADLFYVYSNAVDGALKDSGFLEMTRLKSINGSFQM